MSEVAPRSQWRDRTGFAPVSRALRQGHDTPLGREAVKRPGAGSPSTMVEADTGPVEPVGREAEVALLQEAPAVEPFQLCAPAQLRIGRHSTTAHKTENDPDPAVQDIPTPWEE